MAWGDASRKLTSSLGGFTAETVIVMAFTVPSSPSSYGSQGYTSIAEYQGPPAFRIMSLSKSQCDFRNPDPTGANGPLDLQGGVQATINWNVGNAPLGLVAGQTYYFNFRNDSCGQGVCDAAIATTQWPH